MSQGLETVFPYLRPAQWDDVPFDPAQALPLAGRALYQVVAPDGTKEGLFTGYYEPELRGAFSRGGLYQTPLYAPPPDAGPAPTRAEIEAGVLKDKGLEILWCADPVDVFFMHIQGSGKIILPDGQTVRVGFAAKNGHPYTAIGKVLRERGVLTPPITMQNIRAWLTAHPDQAQAILNENASYIFFKQLNTSGPVGASGNVLVSEVSLAVDHAFWPYGLDVIVATTNPLNPAKPLIRLMKTHDTGSAIKGLIRGDIFFGAGEKAALQAGAMAHPGRMWVILPPAGKAERSR